MHHLDVSYRPDNYPEWIPWREFRQQFGLIGKASALGVGGIPSARAGFAPRVAFGKPPDDPDAIATGRRLRRGFNFQVRFRGTGHVILDRFRIHGMKLVEQSTSRR